MITIRRATLDDRPWIVGQVPRLQKFAPPGRTVQQMNEAEARDIVEALESNDGVSRIVLLAERASDNAPAGFMYAKTLVDFFTGEDHGHVSALVVAHGSEGQGIGTLLLAAAEQWAKSRHYRFITLSVFPENPALLMYQHADYGTDFVRMLKLL